MFDVLIIGLSIGCVYALVAIGFTLVYATTGVINFAQGTFVMIGGVVAANAATGWGWPLGIALLAGVGAAVVCGVLLAVCIVIPLWRRGASEFTTILGTLMFLVIAGNVILNTVGSSPLSVPPLTGGLQFNLAGRMVPSQVLWVILALALIATLLTIFLTRRRMGMAMRACSFDQTGSRLLGISPFRIAIMAFALSALIGGIGGVLIAPLQFTSYSIASTYSVKGFLAAIVGGLGNVKGAILGGILVGIFEAFIATYVSSFYLDVFVLAALVAILLIRPRGLFGEAGAL